ncbi:WAT1-related protein [Rosa sericea]
MVSCTWSDVLPFAAMVMVQFTDIGAATISKAAMTKGVSSYVLVANSNALGTVFLLPCFILQNKVSLTFSLLGGQFLLGMIGSSSLLLAYSGINYSSPTLASAMANLIPIFTFILAVIFRMEKLDLRRSSCQAKVLGTIVSVSGAFVVIIYKGSVIFSPSNSPDQNFMMISQQSKWVFGGLMLAMVCLLNATWGILQTSFVQNCPSMITILFFYNFFVTIQCTIFSLIMERTWNAWVIKPDIEMISIVFSALFGSVFHVGVQTWCLHQKGPIFVAMFRPLGVAIAAVMVVIFLGDALHLGSVIGSIIIAVGFYAMMWAQIKEKSTTLMENEVQSLAPSSTQKTPLLQCRTTGEDV